MQANTNVKQLNFHKNNNNDNKIFYNTNFKNNTSNRHYQPRNMPPYSLNNTSNKSRDNNNNSTKLCAFAITKRDTKLIPLYSNNLTNVIINECLQISALIDTGASVSVINVKTLELLRRRGQPCELYECKGITLSAISGNKLNVLGKVYLRVYIGECLLRVPCYVISNMHNNFVLGNDILRKYKVIIDFKNEKLLIKSERVYTVKRTKIRPKSKATIYVTPRTHTLVPGIVGQLNLHEKFAKLGLSSENDILSMPINSILRYTVYNKSSAPIYIKRNTCIGDFCAINKKDTYTTVHTQANARCGNNINTNVGKHTNIAPCVSKPIAQLSKTNSSIAAIKASNAIQPLKFNISEDNLTSEQKIILTDLLNKNRHVFAAHDHDLGEFNGGEFRIELKPGMKPPKSVPHRASPKQRQIIDEEVEKLLKAGVIEPCNSDVSSPVVLVPKSYDEHGKVTQYRMVCDLRGVNACIRQSHYPLPVIADFLDSLGGTNGRKIKYFTTLDCVQGYLQIKVHEDSRDYTAFVTHSGMWRFKRLPFGISSASSCYMEIMNNLFRKLLYKSVLVYLDDIICFSQTFEEHVQVLQEVFNILANSKMKLKAITCKFAERQVKYLGHIVSEDGLSPNPETLHAIRDWPTPKNVKQVRQFLGTASYYRRFVNNFSKYSAPLTKLTRKDAPFIWTAECQQSFETLKERLLNPPIVAYPIYDAKFTIFTDSSGYSLSAALTQIQDGHERIISCVGRNMLPAETRYTTYEKESLAIFYAFKKFDSYIRYTHVDVITDCKSLCEILKKSKSVSPRIAKWVYYMCMNDYDVIYRPGARNHVDGLSRLHYETSVTPDEVAPPIDPYLDAVSLDRSAERSPLDSSAADGAQPGDDGSSRLSDSTQCAVLNKQRSECRAEGHDTISEIIIEQRNESSQGAHSNNDSLIEPTPDTCPYGTQLTLDIIKIEQKLDLKLKPLIDYISTGTLPNDEKLAKSIILQSDNYNYTDGMLYHQQASRAKNIPQLHIQLVIPENLKLTILKECHDNLGHRGIINTFHTIQRNYFWHNMYKDCHHYVQSCETCMKHKHPQKKDRQQLNPIPVKNSIYTHWFADILGPLKTTKHGHSYIFTCIDSFSKLVEIIPLKDITAHTVAKALFDNIICRYGCFETISTDRGTQFSSILWANLIKLCKSQHIMAASYHHASVGQVERENQSIERILAKYVNLERSDWDEYLSLARHSINMSVTESTGVSPYLLVYGRELKLPLDIALKKPDKLSPNVETELEDIITKVTLLDKIVKDNIDAYKVKMKQNYDKKSTSLTYRIGQPVWLYLFQLPKNLTGKLQTSWYGPYRIIGKEGFNYKLRKIDNGAILPIAVHPDRLQPYIDRLIHPPIPPTPPPRTSEQSERQLSDCALGTDLAQNCSEGTIANSNENQNASDDTPVTEQSDNNVTPPQPLIDQSQTIDDNNEQAVPKLRIARPAMIDQSNDRKVHSIPKARASNDTVEYYIIYDDQINKNVGEYVPDSQLTNTEKEHIAQNKDKIRFLRNKPVKIK